MAENCEHKFIHFETESFSESSGRNFRIWKKYVRLFCEKCGEIKETVQTFEGYHDAYNLPDWAKTITNHRSVTRFY